MSGHSKWSTIKRKKAVQDARRGQQFTKVARLITAAVAKGGPDAKTNPSLRTALEKAKEVNMPKQVVERAMRKGDKEGRLEALVLEGYGPHGVAVLVEARTDNRNRTVAEVRRLFSSHGGSLGESGSAAYIFKDKKTPLFSVELSSSQAAAVEGLVGALEAHADVVRVYTNLVLKENG